jgi:hypothetical protein
VPVPAVIGGGSDTRLYPGATGVNDAITITNSNVFAETVTALTAGSSKAFTATAPNPLGGWVVGKVPAGTVTSAAWSGSVAIPAHGSAHVTIKVSMAANVVNPSQGQTFSLPLTGTFRIGS